MIIHKLSYSVFDFVLKFLDSHKLERSLLHMMKDDDIGLESLYIHVSLNAMPNPFDVIRERLAMVDLAFGDDLKASIHLILGSHRLLFLQIM